MSKTIVFDLEGVLIVSISEPILHPEAKEVLKKSKKDFYQTYLWTLANEKVALPILKDFNLLEYFNKIIYRNSEETQKARLNNRFKDLTVLGNPENFILIDDILTELGNKKLGYPLERSIHIESFIGQKNHSLLIPYQVALSKFNSFSLNQM